MNIFANLIVKSAAHHQAIVDAVHAQRLRDPEKAREALEALLVFHQSPTLAPEMIKGYIADLVATSAASEGFDSLASDPAARLGTHQLALSTRG